jgi:hypothetical protein
VTWDDVANQAEGNNNVFHGETTYSYTALCTDGPVIQGAFLGGVVTYSATGNYKIAAAGGRDNSPNDTSMTTTHGWWGEAVQTCIVYDRNTDSAGTVQWTTDLDEVS